MALQNTIVLFDLKCGDTASSKSKSTSNHKFKGKNFTLCKQYSLINFFSIAAFQGV